MIIYNRRIKICQDPEEDQEAVADLAVDSAEAAPEVAAVAGAAVLAVGAVASAEAVALAPVCIMAVTTEARVLASVGFPEVTTVVADAWAR